MPSAVEDLEKQVSFSLLVRTWMGAAILNSLPIPSENKQTHMLGTRNSTAMSISQSNTYTATKGHMHKDTCCNVIHGDQELEAT